MIVQKSVKGTQLINSHIKPIFSSKLVSKFMIMIGRHVAFQF